MQRTHFSMPQAALDLSKVVLGLLVISVLLLSSSVAHAQPAPPANAVSRQAPAWTSAGAKLPISYDASLLSGTVRYVATNGNDTSHAGNIRTPYATLAKAYDSSNAHDTILVRGGTYRQGNIIIKPSKPVRIIAYPGEIPVFNGATKVSDWTTEDNFKYSSYSAIPVTDGSGIAFTSGQNLTGAGDGKLPDQAWVGAKQLKQVQTKGALQEGMFYVEGSRLYVMASDANKGNLEVSSLRNFINIQAPGTKIEGIKVTRYSNSANDYGVIKISPTADKTLLKNVIVSNTSFIAVTIAGNSDLNIGTTLKNVTISYSNWMGVNPTYTDNLTFDRVYIHNMNQWGEFSYSPQSGAIKTSRTHHTKVLNSQIRNNKGHGIWFDQSNYDAQIAGNVIADNLGSAVFFEISDDLLLINNYIRTPPNGDRAVKLAGSSGLKLINNTILGGSDPVGIYVDNRSKPGCANPANALCSNSYSSDRDTVRPYQANMSWMPQLDIMINNVIAYPARAGYCSVATTVCITQKNGSATVPISSIIHNNTTINGNVYANGKGPLIVTPAGTYDTTNAFAAAMGKTSANTSASLRGNSYVASEGTPTTELEKLHKNAVSIPTNAIINQYLPAGTKHYGVIFK